MINGHPLRFILLALLEGVELNQANPFSSPSSHVVNLTASAYENEIDGSPSATKPNWIVLHYASTCPHCHRFAPYFEAVAEHYAGSSEVRFAAIDLAMPSNKRVVHSKDIRFFPLVRLIRSESDNQVDWRSTIVDISTHPPSMFLDRVKELFPTSKSSELSDHLPNNSPTEARELSTSTDDLISDATIALSVVLNQEVFRGDTNTLNTKDTAALYTILELCATTMQDSVTVTDCESLLMNLINQPIIDIATWTSLLDQTSHFKPLSSLPSYKTCNMFSCALWRLLHVFSLGKGGNVDKIEPMKAMDGIRTVVDSFLSCADCREHFLDGYDNCLYGRCDNGYTNLTWKELALWLWRFHNGVTERVTGENALWPSADDCPTCVSGNSYNEEHVYTYLKSMFLRNSPNSMDTQKVKANTATTKGHTSSKGTKTVVFTAILLLFVNIAI